jgi:co-chaperonin GroES (HSP10)
MTEKITIPPNFPIPRKGSVIIKQIVQGTLTTESGLVLPDTAMNVQKPNVGLIYAVGDEVPDDLKPGMRVYYNQYADLTILINGLPYLMFSEKEVYCILQPENHVKSLIIGSDEVRRGKKQGEHAKRVELSAKINQNDTDKRFETSKKTIKKATKKK